MDYKRFLRIVLWSSLVFLLLYFGKVFLTTLTPESASQNTIQQTNYTTSTENQTTELLFENKSIYNQKANTIEHIYLTIFNEEKVIENDFDFSDLNSISSRFSSSEVSPTLKVLFQTGDETGPSGNEFSQGTSLTNAEIEVRGRSARSKPQKSYKIRLEDSAGLWFGQKVLNLNKHYLDPTRIKNKLAFDYLEEIGELNSLRTNFVVLHVKDQTENPSNNEFLSLGLFTHVEQLNKIGLSARGLNPNGNLYKVENFEFLRYPEALKLATDPTFDKDTFESRLKISQGTDHTKLLKMLDDVNDYSLNFDKTFDKYFDENNVLSFIAFNLLMGNYDTMSTNYYLYSPVGSDKWALIPWDFDKALEILPDTIVPPWQMGLSRYWANSLFKRYFKDPENVDKLLVKIEELRTIINEENTKTKIAHYTKSIDKFKYAAPDLALLPKSIEESKKLTAELPQTMTAIAEKIYHELEKPMPIFLAYQRVNEKDIFNWEAAYDLQGDDVQYTFILSRDHLFQDILYKETVDSLSFETSYLPRGRYYYRVLATDTVGNEQIPFDYSRVNGRIYWGMKEIIIP